MGLCNPGPFSQFLVSSPGLVLVPESGSDLAVRSLRLTHSQGPILVSSLDSSLGLCLGFSLLARAYPLSARLHFLGLTPRPLTRADSLREKA